jgi:hypothetical protein
MRNADRQWHGVFSVTPGLGFELGKRAPGRVDTLRFAHPGTVNVRCDIHPESPRRLLIVPNHAFVRVDSLGRWALPDLPAGTYALRAWRPGARTLRQDVDHAQARRRRGRTALVSRVTGWRRSAPRARHP